jgi:hypothetical protein
VTKFYGTVSFIIILKICCTRDGQTGTEKNSGTVGVWDKLEWFILGLVIVNKPQIP